MCFGKWGVPLADPLLRRDLSILFKVTGVTSSEAAVPRRASDKIQNPANFFSELRVSLSRHVGHTHEYIASFVVHLCGTSSSISMARTCTYHNTVRYALSRPYTFMPYIRLREHAGLAAAALTSGWTT